MPWLETAPLDQRRQFIEEWRRGEVTVTDLCSVFGISRKTGYKWIGRYDADGQRGLVERSRAPLSCRHATDAAVEERIVELRKAHPTWGPRKLVAILGRRQPGLELPAASTAGAILKRRGLSKPRRRRPHVTPFTQPFKECIEPNAVWCADFKGQFAVGSGEYCYPLTISDGHSRYLLACEGLNGTTDAESRPVFERVFREYGLPWALRTDNGPPFASTALGSLSRLAVWWIRLGITPERIEPGKPQQNGRHERMHLTLKRDTALPPRSSLRQQQRAFDAFRGEYNNERPHEAIDMRPPISLYVPSARPYPARLPEIEYPTGTDVRRVRSKGEIKWHGGYVFVSELLAGQPVGLEEMGDGIWAIRFGPLRLAHMDDSGRVIHRLHGRLNGPRW